MIVLSISPNRVIVPLWRYMVQQVSRCILLWRDLRSSKKALQSTLLARRRQLRPGWYRLNRSVAYRIGAPVPAGLQQAKTHRLERQLYPFWGYVVRALDSAVPPIVVRVKGSGRERVEAASQLMISAGGSTRLFNLSARTVTTYHANRRKAAQILAAHAALRDALPVVGMSVTADGSGITEPLIEGGLFSEASADDQICAYRRLLAAYVAHTASVERSFWSRRTAEVEFNESLKLRLPRELRSRLLSRKSAIIEGLHASPVIASHSDLTAQNVLVGPDGPVMVDIESACHRPFFYDPLTLPYTEARSGRPLLLNSIRAGAFSEIDALLTVANVIDLVDHDLLWLMFIVVWVRTWGLDTNVPAKRVRFDCAPLLETQSV